MSNSLAEAQSRRGTGLRALCVSAPLRETLVVWLLLAGNAAAVVQSDYDPSANRERAGVMRRAVMLRYTPLQVCGGSGVLIGPRHVLTAGHAAKGWSAKMLTVDLVSDLDGGKKRRVAVEIILPHPDEKIDLALLRLAEPVDIDPAPLPISSLLLKREPRVGERVWIGGYGVYGLPGGPRGVGRFHAGYNRVEQVADGRAKIRLDRDGVPGEALPAAMDSGSPVWVETAVGWRLSGVTVTASGRTGPKFGDVSRHQTIAPVRGWLAEILSAERVETPKRGS